LLPEEVEKLLKAARADDVRLGRSFALPLLRLLSATGARVGEVLALEWGARGLDLRSDPPAMRVNQSKTDAGVRDVWLDAETASVLRAHRAATGRPRDGSPVFRRGDGERADRFGIARATITRVARAAGVPGVSPHVFRHTHVTQLVADGGSIVDIAARVGHADPRHTLSLYAKPTDAGRHGS
jgi:integrase